MVIWQQSPLTHKGSGQRHANENRICSCRCAGPCAGRSDGPWARPRCWVAKPIRSEMANSDSFVAKGGERFGRCERKRGDGWRHTNIEQWIRSRRGALFSVGSAFPDGPQPEEAVSVPVRACDRLGDLRKAAVDATIPGVPVVEDHDPLQTAVPFADQQSSGFEPDALARRRAAGHKKTDDPLTRTLPPGLSQTPQDRPDRDPRTPRPGSGKRARA